MEGNTMRIAGTEFNLNRKCLEIYLSGCKAPRCPGCHNPELWDFMVGSDFYLWYPKFQRELESGMVEEVWILGGEPQDQNIDDLVQLLEELKDFKKDLDIALFTRYVTIHERLVPHLSYVKIGEFDKQLGERYDQTLGITLASNNQQVINLKEA